MPNRIIRDAVLDSPRFHSLSSDSARLLFLEMLLIADDYGLLPAYPLFLQRRTASARRCNDEAVVSMLSELADRDLLRMYIDKGTQYAYIPRFGNSPRARKPKWPLPPESLGLKEIKHLQEKRIANAVHVRADAPETETETETETEEKKRSSRPALRTERAPTPDFNGENGKDIPEKAIVAIAEAFELPEDWGTDAEALGWKPRQVMFQAERFRQYWSKGKGSGTRRSLKGWRQTWSNWLEKAARDQR